MNKLNGNFVGLLAGIAAGLLAIAALSSGLSSAALIFLTPIAIYIASMGWGTIAGVISAIVASAFCYIYGGLGVAISTGLIIFAPAAWVGHLSNLGQVDEDGNTLWYPLSDILFRLTMVISAVCLGILLLVDFNGPETAGQLREILIQASQNNPEIRTPTDEDVALTLKLITSILPIVAAATWVFVHATNAYLGAVITHSSGQLVRQRDDVAMTITLPKYALFVLGFGFIATVFGSGFIVQIGGVLFGASATAFALLGLADAHLKARSTSGGTLMLIAAYSSIFMFILPILVFTGIGVMRLFRMASQEANNNKPN